MNTIRNAFRFLFQPIQVEVRFPLMAWILLFVAVITTIIGEINTIISEIEIVCK